MKIISAIILSCFCFITADAADERIFIDAKINGKPVRFAFDTGFELPYGLFSSDAEKLGLKITPSDYKPSLGKIAIGTTELCDLDFGITNFRAALGVIEIPTYVRKSMVGWIGWSALNQNIFSLDAAKQEIIFLTDLPEELTAWTKVRVKTNSQLTLEIPGAGGINAVVVDTGKDRGIAIHPKKWQEWKAAHANQPATIDASYMSGAGLVVKEESFAQEFSLGQLTLTDVPIMEANQAELVIDEQFTASLGLAALKRLDIIIDGKHGIAYLRPKMTPPLPYEHNRLGAVFVPRNLQSNDLVAHVVDGSPAHKAGIRNDDILLTIGELDATKWRTDPAVLPLSRFWNSPAGTKLELTLKRGDKIFKTTSVLRNILPPDSAKNSN
jgi:hypothetical protein